MTLRELARIAKQLEAMGGTERMPTEIQRILRALGRHPKIEPWGEFWISEFPTLDALPLQFSAGNLTKEYVTRIVTILEREDLIQWERHLRGRELPNDSGNGGNGAW